MYNIQLVLADSLALVDALCEAEVLADAEALVETLCDAEMLSDTDTLIESEIITLLISMLSREWIAGSPLLVMTEFDALVDALNEAEVLADSDALVEALCDADVLADSLALVEAL